ncbi:MAG: putative Ig domain-containing protein, partial [Rhodocyclaceae bacterium]|nr:putative Ig domain-containing protein [Rhodocyclaceae bacterium]
SGATLEYSSDGTNWSTSAPSVAEGSNTVYVRQTDAAGNVSASSAAYTYTLDTVVAPPAFALAADTGSNATDGVTSNGTVNVTLASDVASWEYSTDGGDTWTSGTGTSFTLPEGTYATGSVLVRQTDTAGNTSVPAGNAAAIAIDTTPPPAPSVDAQSSSSATPQLSGNATVGAGDSFTVTVDGHTYQLGDGHLSLSGSRWTLLIPPAHALADGPHEVVATVADAAGNSASDSSHDELLIDTSVPQAPTVDDLTSTSTTPTLGGTVNLRAGDSFSVTVDGVTYVPGDGHLTLAGTTWQLAIPPEHALATGTTYAVSARVTGSLGQHRDASGNVTILATQVQPPAPPQPEAPPPPPPPAQGAAEPAPQPPAPPPAPLVPPEVVNPGPPANPLLGTEPLPALPDAGPPPPATGTLLVSVPGAGTDDPRLLVVTEPPARQIEIGTESSFQVPSGVFRNTDPAARTQVSATLADGSPLPPWLQFDGSTGRFTGTPPAGSPPALDVKLTARDDRGNTASTQFAV